MEDPARREAATMTCRSPIEEHDHRSGLSELILQALRDAGKDPDARNLQEDRIRVVQAVLLRFFR